MIIPSVRNYQFWNLYLTRNPTKVPSVHCTVEICIHFHSAHLTTLNIQIPNPAPKIQDHQETFGCAVPRIAWGAALLPKLSYSDSSSSSLHYIAYIHTLIIIPMTICVHRMTIMVIVWIQFHSLHMAFYLKKCTLGKFLLQIEAPILIVIKLKYFLNFSKVFL